MAFDRKLLSSNRLDVIFKYLALKLKKDAPDLARKIYYDHIKIITNGLFVEIDNNKKDFQDFEDAFNFLEGEIKNNGFDKKISKIPLSREGTIVNGAHRLAISLFYNKSVSILQTSQESHNYNYLYFKTRGLTQNILELGVLNQISLTSNNYLAIIWPISNKNIIYTNEFKDILYEKKVLLNANGAQNFIAQVYKKHKWLGDFENGYSGAITKVSQVFKRNHPIHLIFFKEKSLKKVNYTKEKLRNAFSIGKSSIHITDNQQETFDLANLVLNDKSEHFLNYSKPYEFKSLFKKLKSLKDDLERNKLDPNDLVLTGSTTMGIYGIREPKDVDYLSNYVNLNSDDYQNHKSQIKYYSQPIENLIYDSQNYFTFNDFKFLCIRELKKFKERRNEEKDKMDVILIEKQKLKKSIFLKFYFKNILSEYKFKIIALIIPISKKFGFYSIAKRIYKIFRL